MIEKSKPNFIIIGVVWGLAVIFGGLAGVGIFLLINSNKVAVASGNTNSNQKNVKPDENNPKVSPTTDEIVDLTASNTNLSFGDGVKIVNTEQLAKQSIDPLTLTVKLDNSGNLKLNGEDIGDISSPDALIIAMREVFKASDSLKMGDRTTIIESPTKIKKEFLTKLIQSLKEAGAKQLLIHPKN